MIRERAGQLYQRLNPCRLCPRVCKVDRPAGKTGYCKLDARLKIFSTNLHYGEEPPISGISGSGTVFFSGCNLQCVYCQNFAFSHGDNGEIISPSELADRMLILQKRGAININWVTPTPQVAPAVEALAIARERGLTIPLVYNSSGYELLEILQLLEGIVDVYLPDAKYADSNQAGKYSDAPDYPAINRAALQEMFRQVGPLETNADDQAIRGLLIRHLVLPDDIAGSKETLRFIAEQISTDIPVSVMRQYFPAHHAHEWPEMSRGITWEEYHDVLHYFDTLGFTSAYIQQWDDD